MRCARAIVAATLAALLACACANVTAPTQSKTEQQAAALNQRAARAFEQGDYRRAAVLYEQALRLNTGVEHTEGIAANALSLARAHQAAGDAAAAHRVLDELLAERPLQVPQARRAEAQARKAQLHLEANDAARALEWSDQALASCTGCAALPAIQNLRGRSALAAGDTAGALDWADKALAAAGSQTAVERANALRLAGEARLARSEHQAAVAPLEQALEIDRGLGLASRIGLDLMALGRAHLHLGNRAAALHYFARARSVSEAINDPAGMQAAGRAIEGL